MWNIKYVGNGSIARYKARLVARGFIQVHGINYEKTFTPIIRYDTLRIFFAIAAKNNSRVHQLDIVTAFLAENVRRGYLSPSFTLSSRSIGRLC